MSLSLLFQATPTPVPAPMRCHVDDREIVGAAFRVVQGGRSDVVCLPHLAGWLSGTLKHPGSSGTVTRIR